MVDVCKAVSSPVSGGKHKERKPYTITKQRENWTDEEHQKFLEALKIFERDWKKIEGFIGTKSVIQIRSHAQKYFLKVQKNQTGEHVPPPRPKRKSSQPYPQKSKLPAPSTGTSPVNDYSSFDALTSMDGGGDPGNAFSDMSCSPVQLTEVEQEQYEVEQLVQAQTLLKEYMTAAAGAHSDESRAEAQGPDFSRIYQFLGSLFDPDANPSEHVEKLNSMNMVDRETVHVLMHNLSLNLGNDQFREVVERQLTGKVSERKSSISSQSRSTLPTPSLPSPSPSSSKSTSDPTFVPSAPASLRPPDPMSITAMDTSYLSRLHPPAVHSILSPSLHPEDLLASSPVPSPSLPIDPFVIVDTLDASPLPVASLPQAQSSALTSAAAIDPDDLLLGSCESSPGFRPPETYLLQEFEDVTAMVTMASGEVFVESARPSHDIEWLDTNIV